jgi:hypothetical protein
MSVRLVRPSTKSSVTTFDRLLTRFVKHVSKPLRSPTATSGLPIEWCAITLAEKRRDGSLREIDRRRAVLGQALPKSFQEAKGLQMEVIAPAETVTG